MWMSVHDRVFVHMIMFQSLVFGDKCGRDGVCVCVCVCMCVCVCVCVCLCVCDCVRV